MASDTKNVKLGVCKVFFDGTDLGYTKGGVEVSVSTETHKVEIDQFGKTAINEYVMGRSLNVKVPLADTTLANMAALFPGSSLLGTATFRTDVGAGVGADLLASSKLLTLHPIKTTDTLDTDYSDDFTILYANTPGALTYAYKLDEERIFNAEFTGFADPQNGKLFSAGDPFTDAVGYTKTFTTPASVFTTTGLVTTDTGRMVVFKSTAGNPGLSPSNLTMRKKYYLKYISATTASVHLTYEAAVAGTGAVSLAAPVTGTCSFAYLS
jgi:hypothetical protein